MSNSFAEALQAVRGKRQYVARAVNALMESTDADSALLKDVAWSDLLSMPTWCLLSQSKIKELQTACGAVYLQPQIKTSVNGAVLKQFRQAVGDELFNFVFELGENPQSDDSIPTVSLAANDNLHDTIQSVGASVLLGTLTEKPIVKVYMSVLGNPSLVLDNSQCTQAFTLACQAIRIGVPSAASGAQQDTPVAVSEASSQ